MLHQALSRSPLHSPLCAPHSASINHYSSGLLAPFGFCVSAVSPLPISHRLRCGFGPLIMLLSLLSAWSPRTPPLCSSQSSSPKETRTAVCLYSNNTKISLLHSVLNKSLVQKKEKKTHIISSCHEKKLGSGVVEYVTCYTQFTKKRPQIYSSAGAT